MRKPTGIGGYIGINEGGLSFKSVKFADEKEEIEKQIVDYFILEMKNNGAIFLSDPRLNKQDDFDFTLDLASGKILLELTEFVVKEGRELPYNKLNSCRKYGTVVDAFISRILEKNKKAERRVKLDNIKTPIHLLCYITHNDFLINEEIIALIQQELKNISHVFENIFYLSVIDEKKSEVRVLYPSNNPTIDADILNKIRNKKIINIGMV
jgi:hypothetical protein